MAHHFFISYSSKDLRHAQAICALLDESGATYWMAPGSIVPGDPYPSAIRRGIVDSAYVLLLVSRASGRSSDVMNELQLARKYKKKIVPVRVERYEPRRLEYLLGVSQWVDFYGDARGEAERQLKRLAAILCTSRQARSTPEIPAASKTSAAVAAVRRKPKRASADEPNEGDRPRQRTKTRKAGAKPPGSKHERPAKKPSARRPRAMDPEQIYQRTLLRVRQSHARYEQRKARASDKHETEKATAVQEMLKLGLQYCEGPNADYQRARQCFETVAAAGLENAVEILRPAAQSLEKAASGGNRDAMFNLSVCYQKGIAVERDSEGQLLARQSGGKARSGIDVSVGCRRHGKGSARLSTSASVVQ